MLPSDLRWTGWGKKTKNKNDYLVQLLYSSDQQRVAGRVLEIDVICGGTAGKEERGRERETSVSSVRSAGSSGVISSWAVPLLWRNWSTGNDNTRRPANVDAT